MALRKIIKDGYVIKSGYTKNGGYEVVIPKEAVTNDCDLTSKSSIRHRFAEFLLAADIPETVCPKANIHMYACEFD